jgi:hypothetical protein
MDRGSFLSLAAGCAAWPSMARSVSRPPIALRSAAARQPRATACGGVAAQLAAGVTATDADEAATIIAGGTISASRSNEGRPPPLFSGVTRISRGTDGLQTRRWREMDSNPRSPVRRTTLFETPLPPTCARATAAFENARRPVQQLLLPVVDPVRRSPPSSGHGSCYLLLTINKGTV